MAILSPKVKAKQPLDFVVKNLHHIKLKTQLLWSPIKGEDVTIIPRTRNGAMILVYVFVLIPVAVFPIILTTGALKIIVNTTCGPVEGKLSDKAFSFKGVPYALPPVGDLRWRQPVKLSKEAGTCWPGTLKASKFGNSCYQRKPFDQNRTTGSEDCLFLNVWTPTLDVFSGKPVVVWIHGGSLQELNGNWPRYSPTETLARRTDVVYVSMNYRLHAFGFMALQVLADDSDTKTSGNYGFMDMVLALEWVQENIRNFGGDPNKVTLFGQSSGGTAILALISSPLCRGLFHRAYISSASAILNKTATDAFRDNEVFLTRTRCRNAACLRNLTAAEVTSAVPWDVYPYWALPNQMDLPVKTDNLAAICIVDGYLLPEVPFKAWQNGNFNDVPILIGTTANEVDSMSSHLNIINASWDQYDERVTTKLGTFGKQIASTALELYPKNITSPRFKYTSMVSDLRANCPMEKLAGLLAEYFTSPVYKYVVTAAPSRPYIVFDKSFHAKYAFHGWDTFVIFHEIPKTPQSDIRFQNVMQDVMGSFVRTGQLPWAPYPNTTALVSDRIQLVDAYKPQECKFWLDNGFFSYAWAN